VQGRERTCIAEGKAIKCRGVPHLMQGGPNHLPLDVPVVRVGEPEVADLAAIMVVEKHIFLRGSARGTSGAR
jgi:hypothetical protein